VPEPAALIIELDVELADATATEALGAALAAAIRAQAASGFIVYLEGGLGAGKTTLVRGLLAALGHTGRVPSPTYTLVEPYELEHLHVVHTDLYRLATPADCDDLGLRESLGTAGLALIEWPERGGDRLPPADLIVRLDLAGNGRRAGLVARSSRGAALLAQLAAGRFRSRA
jgi:tRNA threonylcarbamoyladenosine biosynthesis protein TsaE